MNNFQTNSTQVSTNLLTILLMLYQNITSYTFTKNNKIHDQTSFFFLCRTNFLWSSLWIIPKSIYFQYEFLSIVGKNPKQNAKWIHEAAPHEEGGKRRKK